MFRYLIYFFTWLATGHDEFGQQGRVASTHLPWLGPAFFVVIPAVGGLVYGPLIYRFAREARGHGVPEVMIAVADSGGRIRPQVSVVKALASAVCIGAGGSVGREGPIVQIGSALASSLGQRVKMPENRLRILVACGAAGGIAATFNAPITGVFFGVEIILREFSIDALFTVMLAAMIADITAIPFLGDKPFLSGFPPGIVLHHARNYLLVAVLAVIAALMGLAFKAVLYATEDLCDRAWKGRPEWARPAVGGLALGLLLLAIPQMYGVGYPVMYKATAGQYALWFLIVLAFAKIAACSLTIGIGGSGGIFAPSLFIGVTSGMAFGHIIAPHLRPRRGAARPVRGGRDGRGVRLRRPRPADLAGVRGGDDRRLRPDPAGDARGRDRRHHLPGPELRHHLHHQAAAPRHRHRPHHPLARPVRPQGGPGHAPVPAVPAGTARDDDGDGDGGVPARDWATLAGPVIYRGDPQALFGTESLAQALRQLEVYGHDGLPVLSADGHQIQGWITAPDVLRAIARQITTAQAESTQAQVSADWEHADPESLLRHPPTPLPGYQVAEITITAGSPAAGRKLGDVAWPRASAPVSVLRGHQLRPPRPEITLAAGDRVSLLTGAPDDAPSHPAHGRHAQPAKDGNGNHA